MPRQNSPTLPSKASSLERKFWGAWTYNFPNIPLLSEFDDIPTWEDDYAQRLRKSKRSRRYRLDFAHEESKVGIEIQGGIYTGGRHVQGMGYERDATKYNLASADGWVIFLVTPRMVSERRWYELIAATILSRSGKHIPGVEHLPPLDQQPVIQSSGET